MFGDNPSLESIIFKHADQITSIGDDAFAECSNLEEFKMPAAVTSIGPRAFKGCSRIQSQVSLQEITPQGKDYAYR